ncbi:unnamed protein product [Pieris macdunnoughi]|uniref:Uncharacterized protein n=1 Tax=Pieris macdunnoughi TaxID=345717 RepID=A0A821SKC4_9NEOP|nr:unnamed protein product [Pieris macdunnoughi]
MIIFLEEASTGGVFRNPKPEPPGYRPHKVLLPPRHIKLGLMKQFEFPGLSEATLKEGVSVGPDIRRLMTDPQFITTMTDL